MIELYNPLSLILISILMLGCQRPEVGAALTPGPGTTGQDPAGKPPALNIGDAVNRFAIELFQRTGTTDKDSVSSPFSVYAALAMTAAGADGKTRAEMTSVLAPGEEKEQAADSEVIAGAVHNLFDSLGQASESGDIALEIANALWVQEGLQLKVDFVSLLKREFDADLNPLDFASEFDDARNQINRWTAERTGGKIDPLLPPGSLNRDTRLVLTNAIYFLGTWKDPFDERATRPGDFLRLGGDTVQVPFMRRTGAYRVESSEDGTVVDLPYRGERIAMAVFLPSRMEDFPEMSRTISSDWFRERLSRLESTYIELSMPRFRIKSDLELSGALKQMGMALAFNPERADFSGISDQADLFIQRVFQGAYIDVNERGTEAAAATGITMGVTSMPPTIRIDRPFLFVIYDRATGAMLFMGRVVDPSTV